jgi:hypothetical protein
VTTWPRTIFDLASVVGDEELGRIVAEAEAMRLTSALSLPDLLERHAGERGAGRLRRVLEADHALAGVTRSALEEAFLAFLVKEGFPIPELNATIPLTERTVEVDCLWREQRVIVELVGLAVHGTRRAIVRDTSRKRCLLLAGYRVIEITWAQLHDPRERAALARDLRRLL